MVDPTGKGSLPGKRALIVAIDGPVGAGKSSVAKLLARRLGYDYVDSGAMYRAVACEALGRGIDLRDEVTLSSLIDQASIQFKQEGDDTRIYIAGKDISQQIRTPQASQASSIISTLKGVRERLVALQRRMGKESRRGMVMEGRDIGTVVFPDADIKFFLDSSLEERTRRRHKDLLALGIPMGFPETLEEIQIRDERDRQRECSPLRPADDSILVDSTHLSIEEVVDLMLKRIRSQLGQRQE
ncbi:MAG: (d)CMP kinase [candidate division NC10 bacterium]|nr:(d)CMP kinase [candidate division NC10 bacterium]